MITKMIKWKHLYPVLSIFLIVIILATPLFQLNVSKRSGDWRNSDTPAYHFIQQYSIEDNKWPLWDHMTFGGRPLFSFGMPLQYPLAIFLSFFFNAYGVINLMMILHLLLAGIGMYFLSYEILKSRKSSLLSSSVYLLCPYILINCLHHPFWIYGVSFIPFELFLAIRSFKSKNFLIYSVLLGIVGALHFLSGGVLQWYYAVMLVSFYLFFKVFGRRWKSRLVKSSLILLIFLFFMFSLSAIRFLPGNEWTSFTNRGDGIPIEEIMRVGHVGLDNIIDTFVVTIDPKSKAGAGKFGQIGLFAFGLLLFGVYSFFRTKDFILKKNSVFIFLMISMFLISLFASGIFLKMIYNFPGINSQRGLNRSLIIYVLGASLFAGLGFNYILEKMKKRNFDNKKIFIVFIITLMLVIGNLLFISWHSVSRFRDGFEHYSITENNPVFLKMAEDESVFRFHVNEVAGVDWNNFLGSSIPLELESIYGMYAPIWDSRYFHMFLASTFRDPPKLWGMLNVKYIVSAKEIDEPDYELIEKFENTPLNTISNANYETTAYLYGNKRYLPRAFFVPASVLVVGLEDYANQLMYASLVSPGFDPSKTIIIKGKETLNTYSLNDLSRHGAIFLTMGSIDQNSGMVLERYKEQGGLILPDVTEGENSIDENDIEDALVKMTDTEEILQDANIISYYSDNPNTMVLELGNEDDMLLFVSEKYKLYPGWTAKIDGEEAEIMLANGVLSAVHVPGGSNKITFTYYPDSFKKGLLITYFSVFIILFYFGYLVYKKVKKHGK